jgi:hypothetical protein
VEPSGYTAFFAGDVTTCQAEARLFEAYAAEQGVTVVRAEAAIMWLGAGRLDRVREMARASPMRSCADQRGVPLRERSGSADSVGAQVIKVITRHLRSR